VTNTGFTWKDTSHPETQWGTDIDTTVDMSSVISLLNNPKGLRWLIRREKAEPKLPQLVINPIEANLPEGERVEALENIDRLVYDFIDLNLRRIDENLRLKIFGVCAEAMFDVAEYGRGGILIFDFDDNNIIIRILDFGDGIDNIIQKYEESKVRRARPVREMARRNTHRERQIGLAGVVHNTDKPIIETKGKLYRKEVTESGVKLIEDGDSEVKQGTCFTLRWRIPRDLAPMEPELTTHIIEVIDKADKGDREALAELRTLLHDETLGEETRKAIGAYAQSEEIRALLREDKPPHAFRALSWWSILGLGGGIDWVALFGGIFATSFIYTIFNLQNLATNYIIAGFIISVVSLAFSVTSYVRVRDTLKAIHMAHPEFTIWQALTRDIGHDFSAQKELKDFSPYIYTQLLCHETSGHHVLGLIAFIPRISTIIDVFRKRLSPEDKKPKNLMKMTPFQILKGAPEDIINHTLRNARITERIARELGLPEKDIDFLKHAIWAHDIGQAEKSKHPEALSRINAGMAGLPKEDRTEPVDAHLEVWLENIAPKYGVSKEEISAIKTQVQENGNYYPIWALYNASAVLRKNEPLTTEEDAVVLSMYKHGARSVAVLIERNIACTPQCALLISCHHDYSELERELEKAQQSGSISQEEANRLRLLESILIVADIFEQGNNYERMVELRGRRRVENFSETFNGYMRKRFDEIENIKERRPLEALKALISRMDTDLFKVIADARETSGLMPEDLEFIMSLPEFGKTNTGVMIFKMGLPESLRDSIIRKLENSGIGVHRYSRTDESVGMDAILGLWNDGIEKSLVTMEKAGIEVKDARGALAERNGIAFSHWFSTIQRNIDGYPEEGQEAIRILQYALECLNRGVEVIILNSKVSRRQLVASYGEEGVDLLKEKLGEDTNFNEVPFQDFLKYVVIGATDVNEAHTGSIRREIIKPALRTRGALSDLVTLARNYNVSRVTSFIANGVHCPNYENLDDEKKVYASIGTKTPPKDDHKGKGKTPLYSLIALGVIAGAIFGAFLIKGIVESLEPGTMLVTGPMATAMFVGVAMSFSDEGGSPSFIKRHVILKTDGTISDTGNSVCDELLGRALSIIKDRKFITEHQFQLIGGNVEFEIVENTEFLADAVDRSGKGDWVLQVNRFFFDYYEQNKEVFATKLAYLIARQLDLILFTEFIRERHIESSQAEISTICLLRDTSRLNDNRDDGEKVLGFYRFIDELSQDETKKSAVELFQPFEREYADLINKIYEEEFYGINFVGEPKWLDFIVQFFNNNKAYYGIRWYNRAISYVLGLFYRSLTELDKKYILRHLRWYENYTEYKWLRKKLAKQSTNLTLDNGRKIPLYYNESNEDYSSFELMESLERRTDDGKETFLHATIKALYPETELKDDDLKEIYVRFLGEGTFKDAFYYIVVTEKGCFEFVLWLPHKLVDDEGHEYRGPHLLTPIEYESLEWANIQHSNRSPKIGAFLPGDNKGNVQQMSVSYLGKELSHIVGRRNTKLLPKAKEEFIRSAIACYVGSAFRMGGFLNVSDPKPANLASLDMKIGIVDYGIKLSEDKMSYFGGLLKFFYSNPDPVHGWLSYYSDIDFDKRKIFDAFIDTFTNYVGSKKVNLPYRIALGIDLLKRLYEDPYKILVNKDTGEDLPVKKALGEYLEEVMTVYRPSLLLGASSLTEDFNWNHVNDRFAKLPYKDVTIDFGRAVIGDDKQKDPNPYWYIARQSGIREEAEKIEDLNAQDMIKIIDYILMDHLTVPSNEYLVVLKKLSDILNVKPRAPDNVNAYRAWIRTLKEQALRLLANQELKTRHVDIQNDIDGDFLLRLSKTQVRNVLEKIVSLPKSYKPLFNNIHIDLRKEEIILLQAILWAKQDGGSNQVLLGLIKGAESKFVNLGRAASDIDIAIDDAAVEEELQKGEGISKEKIKAKLLVDKAVSENVTRLNIYDESLVEDAINYAEEKGYILTIDRISLEGEPRTVEEVFAYRPVIGDLLSDLELAMPSIQDAIQSRSRISYQNVGNAEVNYNNMEFEIDRVMNSAIRNAFWHNTIITSFDSPANFARNIPAGTIISMFKPNSPKTYKNLICSAYILHGPITTMMVNYMNVKTGKEEVAEFVWDFIEGRFLLRKRMYRDNSTLKYQYTKRFRGKEGEVKHQDIYTPVGARSEFPEWLNNYIVQKLEAKGHKLRYTESIAANLNEILHSGGIVVQKVRLHEAVTLARLVESLGKHAFFERLRDENGKSTSQVRLFIGDEGQIEHIIGYAKRNEVPILEIDTQNQSIVGLDEESEASLLENSKKAYVQRGTIAYKDGQGNVVTDVEELPKATMTMREHLRIISNESLEGEAQKEIPQIIDNICGGIQRLILAFSGRAGKTDKKNVSGDIQAGLDVFADNFLTGLIMDADVRALTSEELADKNSLEDFDSTSDEVQIGLIKSGKVAINNGFLVNIKGKEYLVTLDPLDGSSKIDSNGTVGTIVNIYAYDSDGSLSSLKDLNNENRLASFFILYGPYTTVLYTLGQKGKVHEAVMDEDGRFYVTEKNIKIPEVSNISTLALGGTRNTWFGFGMPYTGEKDETKFGFVDLVNNLEKEHNMRSGYSGALVGDIYTLIKNGGIFTYPGGKGKNFHGKLRMWFELHSIGNIVEKAGGATLTYTTNEGIVSIDEVSTDKLDAELPFYAGNKDLIERFKRSLIIDLGHYVGEDALKILVKTFNNPKTTGEEKALIIESLENMYRESGTEELKRKTAIELGGMIKKFPVTKAKIVIGIPKRTAQTKRKKLIQIMETYKDKAELIILESDKEERNLEELKALAKEKNIQFVARMDLKKVKVRDIEMVLNTFIEQMDRDRFSLIYAKLASLSRKDVENKGVSELQDILHIVIGEFLNIRSENIDERIARGEYWQLRGLVADNTILGMENLLSEIKQIDEPHAAVVSNVMIESDASVLAKVKAKRLHKGLSPVKDVLTIFNPEITRENVDVYLSELGAEGVFDEVILYSELERKEGKIDENNIVRVVKSVVGEKLNLDEEHIVLVGGEVYFREIAGMVVAILTGDIDKYIDELSKFLERYGSAYEEALIGIYTKDEELLAKLREKRTLKEESDSYKEYIEDYRRFIKEVITKL